MLALESFVLNSSFEGLKFVWWWSTAPMKEIEGNAVWQVGGESEGDGGMVC